MYNSCSRLLVDGMVIVLRTLYPAYTTSLELLLPINGVQLLFFKSSCATSIDPSLSLCGMPKMFVITKRRYSTFVLSVNLFFVSSHDRLHASDSDYKTMPTYVG